MKVSKYIAFPITYAVCLVLLANEAQAKVSTTQQVEDMSKWTQDQVYAYLDKYNILYDKKDENLLDTATKYRDSALANTKIFITDKVDGITRLMDSLKIKLEKQYNLGTNSVDGLITDLTHQLRQLELSGKLTEDQVKQSLDQYQKKAIKQKYVTEAQWKGIANDIEHSFAHPTWYQRIFHTGPSSSSYFNEDAFHNWITHTVKSRALDSKEYTQQQLDAIGSTLQNAIQATSASIQDLSQIGSKSWWQQFSKDVQKNAGIKKDQAQSLVDSLSSDINAYKIFAMNYAGDAADQTQNFIAAATQYIMDKGNDIYQAVVHPIKPHHEESARSAVSSASHAAASATSSAASSASSLAAKVAETVAEYKDYAADNANYAKDYVADNANYAKDYVADNANYAKDYVSDSASNAKDYVADNANYAKDYVADSASSAKDYVADSASSAKNNFGQFWRQKELDTYRRIGYTQAHIDWLENYLSKTFYSKTNYAKDTVHDAIQTIRTYLIDAKVQTVQSIDSQLKSLENMIDHWRRNRDEL